MSTEEIMQKGADALASIADAFKTGLADRDLLIRIDSKLDNHINNCKSKTAKIEQHIAESPTIRDTVRDNKRTCDSLVKACWIIFGCVVGLIAKMMWFN